MTDSMMEEEDGTNDSGEGEGRKGRQVVEERERNSGRREKREKT